MFAYCNNCPCDSFDEDGQMQRMRKELAAYGGGGGAGIIAGLVTIAAAAVQGIAYAAKQTAKVVVKAVSKAVKRATEKKHIVYHLVDENNNNKVEYVGRTCNEAKRKAAHKRNEKRRHLEMVVVARNLSYEQARALEQISMTYHHTINTANKVNNQINGVSPNDWGCLAEIGKGTLNYAENKITNEILWWAGS